MQGKKKLLLVSLIVTIILGTIIFLFANNKVVESMQAKVENANAGTASTLVSAVQASDYGKSTNYTVTVNGTTLDDWKVFYNDGSHVYIILADYLPNNLLPTATGLQKSGSYGVYSSSSITSLYNGLTTTSYWADFAKGAKGATATGAPDADLFQNSYKAKFNTSFDYYDRPYISNVLYIPHTAVWNNCQGYWVASNGVSATGGMWIGSYGKSSYIVYYNGYISNGYYSDTYYAARPVVCLSTDTMGIVDTTVKIGAIYNLTVNPNGGTWNGTTANSTESLEQRNN